MVRKFNRINPVSALSSVAEKALIGEYKSVNTAVRFSALGIGATGLGLGALLVGLPLLAFKGLQKAPEWLDKGFKWMEKNIKEFSDLSIIDSQVTSSWNSAQQFVHKNIWRIKPAKA